MKLKRLFNSLNTSEKDKVCAAIIEAGLCAAVGSVAFRDFLKPVMFSMRGNSREYIKLFRRLDADQQNLFYDAMTSYEALPGDTPWQEPVSTTED